MAYQELFRENMWLSARALQKENLQACPYFWFQSKWVTHSSNRETWYEFSETSSLKDTGFSGSGHFTDFEGMEEMFLDI